MPEIKILATDLDGTFIPLDGHQQNRSDLARLVELLARHSIELVYVTGRHFDLVTEAIRETRLPNPTWMICDVGTSIYRQNVRGQHDRVQAYELHLGNKTEGCPTESLHQALATMHGLRRQEAEKQGRFKLSYYCPAGERDAITHSIMDVIDQHRFPYHVISSVDPFTGDGLIDLMPTGVNKAYALNWWANEMGYRHDQMMFAGDSGNDLAALCEGYNGIVVGNSPHGLKTHARDAHRKLGFKDRLFCAEQVATSGVLEGVRHFLNRQ